MLLRLAPVILLLLVSSCSSATSISKAQRQASQNWLALVDNRAYEASWDGSAAMFQKAVSKQNWVRQIRNVRSPMGQVLSRQLRSSDVRENLTGQPLGIYTIFIYRSTFANKGQVQETHTVYRANSGQPWLNAGYSIN